MPADLLARVTAAVGRAGGEGKTADVTVRIDASLIGGMTLRIGDTLIDGSVATQLKKMETELMRRGVSSLQGNVAEVLA
jgi:F-type H+-transporting ATPase subunit delta